MICGILGPGGCGGTFLDWSLNYLSGQTQRLVIECDSNNRGIIQQSTIQTIADSPIKNSTAHLHTKTHPNDQSLPGVINEFVNNKCALSTFYYVDSMLPQQTQTHHNDIVKQYPNVKFVTYVFDLVHVDWIFCFQYEKILSAEERFKQAVFVKQINANIIDCASPGELRELLSLYYPRAIKGQILNEEILKTDNNYLLSFSKMFVELPSVLIEIFEYLNLKIDQSKYNDWLNIYNQWLTNNPTKFFIDLPLIVDCIVQGKELDLSQYSMTFAKEIVLASKLLYDHNLALKFEGVDDLSSSTIQWHNILEPNIYHQLT